MHKRGVCGARFDRFDEKKARKANRKRQRGNVFRHNTPCHAAQRAKKNGLLLPTIVCKNRIRMQNYVTRPQLHRNDGRTLPRSGKGNCPAAIHAVWPSRTSGGTTSIVAHICGGIMFCADKRKASHGLSARCVFTAPPLANFLLLYGSLKLAHVQPFRLLRAPL